MKYLVVLLSLSISLHLHAQLTRGDIKHPDFADSITWSQKKKDKLTDFVLDKLTRALIVYHNGKRVYQYGDTQKPYMVFSMRKSIISLIYGIYVEKGTINLQSTLAEMKLDDKAGLSAEEKNARIIDLLKARSGVYHKAAFETNAMVRERPERGVFKRDEHWYYNNWDFNALVTIFENHTGKSLFQAFAEDLANPLGMSFDISIQKYHYEEVSEHPATLWYFTAEDLALLGQLLLSKGEWNGEQLVSSEWITESTVPYSDCGIRGAYGYCWWVAEEGFLLPFVNVPDGTYAAQGTGQQSLIIIPEWELMIVHQTEVKSPDDPRMKVTDFGKMLKIILEQSWF
ncbi:MAG: serine hydrolase [Cyclobacteriaceae bacterium]